MDTRSSAVLRWVTLLTVLANIAFNYFYVKLTGNDTMGEVSARYPSLFTPAGYAFSIWGLIYLSFIIYCIAQLQKTALDKKIYNQLSLSLLFANVLASVWIWCFTSERLLVSIVVMFLILALSLEMFIISCKAAKQRKHSWWLQFPFSLLSGWLSVAFLANLSVVIASQQGKENVPLTFIFLAIAALTAIYVGFRTANPVYPSVTVWASLAIWVARKDTNAAIGNAAAAVAIIAGLVVLTAIVRLSAKRKLS